MQELVTVKKFSDFVREFQNGMIGKNFIFEKDIACSESNKNQVPLYMLEQVIGNNVQCFCISLCSAKIEKLSEVGNDKVIVLS